MNEFEKNRFATFVNNGDGWERIPNAKFMMRDENGTEIEMTPNEVIKQLMQDNKSLEHYINNLQSRIDKISEYVDKIYDVMDYRDYPPYLDEIYYTLHPELKEEKTDEETVQS